MVIRIKIYHEESKKEREVTTDGDFYEFYLKVLNLIGKQEKSERKSQMDEIGIDVEKIKTLIYTNPKTSSGNIFDYKFIYSLVEEEIYDYGLKLNSEEKHHIRTIIDRLAKNKDERLKKVQRAHFRVVLEGDFFREPQKELV